VTDKKPNEMTLEEYKGYATKLGYNVPDSQLEEDYRAGIALADFFNELADAMDKHKPYSSFHNGWANIQEEVEELWELVKDSKPGSADLKAMRSEALQIAVTAIRFAADLCHDNGKN
jgi:hypothetical protein